MLVEVIWHGHACFEVRGTKAVVVFDPFEGLGIPEPRAEADVVLCSHSHRDHNNFGPVLRAGGTVLEGFVGVKEIHGVSVKGIASFHDAVSGSQRGANSIYVVPLDEVRFCHLGDLGHELTDKHVEDIGEIDVLFTPVGGGPTIGPDLAAATVEQLNPRIVVPMHYNAELPGQSEWMEARLHKVDAYLTRSQGKVERLDSPSLHITKATLPKDRTIIVPSFM
jgi:L-ascorbate metabolism protein UlaG (beta-lactamase superfamily)